MDWTLPAIAPTTPYTHVGSIAIPSQRPAGLTFVPMLAAIRSATLTQLGNVRGALLSELLSGVLPEDLQRTLKVVARATSHTRLESELYRVPLPA